MVENNSLSVYDYFLLPYLIEFGEIIPHCNDFASSYSEATDTVCVIGLVKVKVAGPVQNGERVYASLEVPGVGVPETQLSLRRRDESSPTLLGQALEAKSAQTIDEINLVECFVSIVLGIQSRQVQSAIDDLQRVFQQQAEFKAKKEKRTKRKGETRTNVLSSSSVLQRATQPKELGVCRVQQI